MKKTILFDLDGTLTDSGEGIINCVTLALNHFGLPVPSREELRVFVGPPLRDTFMDFGVTEENVEEAVRVFRSRYMTVGKFENTPYEGIREMLAVLKSHGHRMFIATSKPEVLAVEILEKFELAQYFEIICGAVLNNSRDKKEEVIAYLLEQVGSVENVVMVGDTHFDVLGAKAHGIPTIGVSWGYGKTEDMLNAGAVSVADSTDELIRMIEEY